MKNDFILREEKISLQSQQLNSQNQCSFDNTAFYLCMNKKCTKKALLCSQRNCKCKLQHERCVKGDLESFVNAIKSKGLSLKLFQDIINQIIDDAIDKLSNMRDVILVNFKQTFELMTLTPQQNHFLSQLSQQKTPNITGRQVAQFYQNIYQTNESQKLIEKGKQQLSKISQKLINQIDSTGVSIQRLLISFHERFQPEGYDIKGALQSKIQFRGSKIVKSVEDQLKIKQFFGDKLILNIKLKFRASDENFLTSKFHQKCDNTPNLLFLVETKHDKVIGAYTPLEFNPKMKEVYIQDLEGQSFLFSLTNNEKLSLYNKAAAIFYESDQEYAFRFGTGSDMRIANNANTNEKSYCAIMSSYKNESYTVSGAQLHRRFSGSDTIYFGVKEWEVWEILF